MPAQVSFLLNNILREKNLVFKKCSSEKASGEIGFAYYVKSSLTKDVTYLLTTLFPDV